MRYNIKMDSDAMAFIGIFKGTIYVSGIVSHPTKEKYIYRNNDLTIEKEVELKDSTVNTAFEERMKFVNHIKWRLGLIEKEE